MKEVFEVGLDIIKKIQETQSEKLEQTGHLMAQAFMDGRKLFCEWKWPFAYNGGRDVCSCWWFSFCGSHFDK